MLTLYTTPVIYLYMDRFRLWCQRLRGGRPSFDPRVVQPGE
jgi:multidrug efflux pump